MQIITFKNFLYKDKKTLSGLRYQNIQDGYLNFYNRDCVNPYVPKGACGPWIVTSGI